MKFGVLAFLVFICTQAMGQIPVAPTAPPTSKDKLPVPSTPAAPAAGAPQANGLTPDGKLTPPIWQNTDTHFIESYPHLKDNIYQEPESNFYLGLSAGVLGAVANRQYFSLNFFQVHYITHRWDNEIFSASFGATTTQPSNIQSNHFVFRTNPKIKFNEFLSMGPLVGYEYISFPNISEVIYRNSKQTQPEPFSSFGWLYGASVAETFHLSSGNLIRLTELAYQENYSATDAGNGWTYFYAINSLNKDASPLAAGVVFLIELGFLF